MATRQNVITLLALVAEIRDLVSRHLGRALVCLLTIFIVAFGFTVLRPREYVASMIVVPVETSMTDATSQMLSTGFNLRTQFSLGGPPPQMAAYLKILKSPEVAKFLAQDSKAADAIIDHRLGMIGSVRVLLARLFGITPSPETQETRVASIMAWLDTHMTVDQDVTLMAWTINVRHRDGFAARYILSQVERGSENILRSAAIRQYATQREYITRLADETNDAVTRQTLYNALSGVDRALIALRSGSNVATVEVSGPYVPPGKSYPPRIASFGTASVVLMMVAFALLVMAAYRALRQRADLAVYEDDASRTMTYIAPGTL